MNADSSFTPSQQASLDAALQRVASRKDAWLRVPIDERVRLLRAVIDGVVAVAPDWVQAGCAAKGIDPASPVAGEEWISGPVTTIRTMRLVAQALDAGGSPAVPRWSTRPDGQRVATVFPETLIDRLAYTGMTVEVWIEPGKPATQGAIYRTDEPMSSDGSLCLVLGAGNVSSIGPLDVLDKLFVRNEVAVLKMNPVNDYLAPVFRRAFAPLIDMGVLEIVTGGVDAGRYLCAHALVQSIHLTGSDRTHDAIVWGDTADEQQRRKAAGTPRIDKHVTSELGSVTPILVVPGRWSKLGLRYQARNVASMVAHNASFNCNAGKVLVLARGWAQRAEFLDVLQEVLASLPARRAYYPGAAQRHQAFIEKYPHARVIGKRGDGVVPWTLIPNVPAQSGEYALTTEAFCGVIAETSLDVTDAPSFLAQAVPFANDLVWGTLSCVVIANGATQRAHRRAFEEALAALRYGGIAVNAWTGVNFGIGSATWGAYPGNRLDAIGSGIGVVHNTHLFDHPQKSVVRAPFVMYPWPIWFADHGNLHDLGRRAVPFEASPTLASLPAVALAGLKG